MSSAYKTYQETISKVADINVAIAVLSWDKEVNLPVKAAKMRSRQVTTLSGISHEMITDKEFGKLLTDLYENKDQLNIKERRNIELSYKDFQKKVKLPTEFVMSLSNAVSEAYHGWLKARKENDYKNYQPFLKNLVELNKQKADYLGYEDHPYDALLDEYEPEAKTADITMLFDGVKQELVDFVEQIRASQNVNDDFLKKFYPKDKQWDFGVDLLKKIGYDFDAGRQDLAPHPFTICFSPTDVRVTTRIDENDLSNMTWSTIHEGGHALYEQGLPLEDFGMPIGAYVSLSIHESQSRLWENNVGRSLPFWKAHYQAAQTYFPEQLGKIDCFDFYKGINKVIPHPIRTESDELHYHFHVMIRFEIEKGLIEGNIKTEDIKEIWNEKYKTYLDIDVENDNEGVLQDVHWAHGHFGYFPTYSLGSFYAAQFFAQAQKDLPSLITSIEQGDTSPLLKWLREKIHQKGKMYSPEELCIKVTGEPLNFKYFMDYVKEKYQKIYGL